MGLIMLVILCGSYVIMTVNIVPNYLCFLYLFQVLFMVSIMAPGASDFIPRNPGAGEGRSSNSWYLFDCSDPTCQRG